MTGLIRLLKPLSIENQKLYRYLGIFKAHSWIKLETVERLWKIHQVSLNFADCKALVVGFDKTGLLEYRSSDQALRLPEAFQEANQEYLHSTGTYQSLHQSFLDSYEVKGAWWELVGDTHIFEHLAYHLSEAGQDTELHRLLTASNLWMESKWKKSLSDVSFLADIELAMQQYHDPLSAKNLQKYLELQMVKRLCETRPDPYSDDILKVMVYLGRDAEAIHLARLRPDISRRWMGLYSIWQIFQEKRESSPVSVRELIELGKSIVDISGKDTLLSRFAFTLISDGDFESVKTISPLIKNDGDRGRVLWELGSKLAEAGREDAKEAFQQSRECIERVPNTTNYQSSLFKQLSQKLYEAGYLEEAADVRQRITDADYINRAIGEDVLRLAEEGDFNTSLKLLETMKATGYTCDVLSTLALMLAQAGDKRARKTFTQARKALEESLGSYEDHNQVRVLSTLALRMHQAGDRRSKKVFEEARKIAELPRDYKQGEGLEYLGAALAEASEFSQALALVEILPDYNYHRANVWSKVAAKQAEQGMFEEALALIQRMEFLNNKTRALLELGNHLRNLGDKRASLVYQQLENLAVSAATPQPKAHVFYQLTEQYLQLGEIEEAWRLAQNVPSYHSGVYAMSRVTLHFAQKGNRHTEDALQKTIDAARYSSDLRNQTEIVRKIALLLAQGGDKRASALYSYVQELGLNLRYGEQQDFFSKLSRDFVSLGDFEEAWRSLKLIDDDKHKAYALKELAETLRQKENSLASSVLKDAKLAFDNMVGTGEELCFALANSLIEAGEIEAASELIPKLTSSHFQISANRNLALAFAKAKDSRAKPLFIQSWELIKVDRERHIDRRRELVELQQSLVQAGEVQLALEIVEASPEKQMGRTLSEFVSLLTDEGHYRLALQLARRFYDTRVVANLAAKLADSPMFKEAWELIVTIDSPVHKAESLKNLAIALLAKGDNRAPSIAAYAFEVWKPIEDGMKAYALRVLAVNLGKVSYFQQALQILPAIDNPYHHAYALLECGQQLAELGNNRAEALFKRGKEIADGFNEQQRSNILETLVTIYMALNRVDDAREIIESLSPRSQIFALSRLAIHQLQGNEMDAMLQTVDKMLGSLDSARDYLLSNLAKEAKDKGAFQEARSIIDKFPQASNRFQSLKELALQMARSGDSHVQDVIEDIQKTAQSLPDEAQRLSALASFSENMAEAGIYKQSLQDLKIGKIQDIFVFLIDWHESLAQHYPGDESLWTRVIQSAVRISSWQHQEFAAIHSILAQPS